MPVVEASIVVPCQIEEVFDFIANAENLPVWDATVIECVQVDSEPLGLGTRYRGASDIMGRRFDWTTEVIRFERPDATASRSVEGSLTFTVTEELTSVADGTLLSYRIVAESGLGGAFGRILEPIVEKAQAKSVRTNLDKLADLLRDRAAA